MLSDILIFTNPTSGVYHFNATNFAVKIDGCNMPFVDDF